jgi:hypothetical protein
MNRVDFTLVLDGKSFPIQKRTLVDFFELHPTLFYDSTYEVRSPVSVEVFVDFLNYLESKKWPGITRANARVLYLLSQMFGVFDLSSRCGEFVSDRQTIDSPLGSPVGGLSTNLLSQATEFESFRRDFPCCFSNSLISRLEKIECEITKLCGDVETRLTFCRSTCEELRRTIPHEVSTLESRLERALADLKSTCNQFRSQIGELTIIPRLFPLHVEAPLNGIVCKLTRKHGGNVHDKGIVLMISKSTEAGDVKS